MNTKVAHYLNSCSDCKLFTDKKCHEPQKSHEVPGKCWDKVSMDLFGPMPSKNHIVVVQDLASRFPDAKLVTSTKGEKVLPALANIYDTYGNPSKQLSDNGPPFNSVRMEKFAEERGIQLEKIPPWHPSANPVETFMRPLGKTLKIAQHNNMSENDALQTLLNNYRDTPHPATGVPPASMLFRDSKNSVFPRQVLSDEEAREARKKDNLQKQKYEERINKSKYKKHSEIVIGDRVIIRNYKKQRKFEPIFLPDTFVVLSSKDNGRRLELERESDGMMFSRHPDDVKKVHEGYAQQLQSTENPDKVTSDIWNQLTAVYDDEGEVTSFRDPVHEQHQPNIVVHDQEEVLDPVNEHQPNIPVHEPRYPPRQRQAPQRLGAVTYDTNQTLQGEGDTVAPWWPGWKQGEWQFGMNSVEPWEHTRERGGMMYTDV